MFRILIAMVTFAGLAGNGSSQTAKESDYYTITTFEPPIDEVIEACGFQLMPDGAMTVCSRRGDVFRIRDPFAKNVGPAQFSIFALMP